MYSVEAILDHGLVSVMSKAAMATALPTCIECKTSVDDMSITCTTYMYHIWTPHGYHMYTTWVSHVHHMGITCTTYRYHIWTPHGYHMYTTWVSHAQHITYGHHMGITCTPHGYHMYTTWISHVHHMESHAQHTEYHTCITWVSNVHHMGITCTTYRYHICTPHGYHITTYRYHICTPHGYHIHNIQVSHMHTSWVSHAHHGPIGLTICNSLWTIAKFESKNSRNVYLLAKISTYALYLHLHNALWCIWVGTRLPVAALLCRHPW